MFDIAKSILPSTGASGSPQSAINVINKTYESAQTISNNWIAKLIFMILRSLKLSSVYIDRSLGDKRKTTKNSPDRYPLYAPPNFDQYQ